MLNLLSCLPWRKPMPLPLAQRRPPRRHRSLEADELGLGCGWFDSSHELVHGLVVQEADAVALGALPLAIWLELELGRRDHHALPL